MHMYSSLQLPFLLGIFPSPPDVYFSVLASGDFQSILSPVTKHVTENATAEAKKTVESRLSWSAAKFGTARMLIGIYMDRIELTHTPKEENRNT